LIVYRGVVKSNEETAGANLTKAEDVAAYQSVASNHGKTLAARSALVLLADKQWSDNQQDAAIATLRKFVSENPDHPAVPSAKASLGAKLMTQGKAGDAAKEFDTIVENPEARYVAPYALLCLGDLAAGAGDLDKAEAHYKRIKTDFSDSDFAQSADTRLQTLRAKAPVEIEPPPPPSKPETPAGTLPGAPAITPGGTPNIQITPVEPAPAPQPESPPAPAESKPAETPAAPQP
jgi:predicted negative regulator of RcsB-dependent stress response